MKDNLIVLKPKTKKGKDRINAAGHKWLIVDRKDKVGFDDRPGTWLGLRNCTNFLDFRWVKQVDDNDFEVEFIYRSETNNILNGSDPLERIRNILSPFMCLVDMVKDGGSTDMSVEALKLQTANQCNKLSVELLDHIENLEIMERARKRIPFRTDPASLKKNEN